uniref:Peroxisomal trans-2-enoyl-CoA reductase-like n=1 Tax=Callorhinchus milii TaxID=7868 RepID=V9L6E5_CALMI|eukprot:gi/632944365/ref/XP_007887469.1/ PREDICTED: peroxisomal trans-2-enoyl-CoA reductase-like [Callorhinchus milii]
MSGAGRTVLVLGGAGTVGSGIVKALLEKGCRVAVISRDAARLEKLKSFVPASTRERLVTLVGDVGTEEGAEAAKNSVVKALGKVTDIVSSLGFSWWQGGPPHTQSLKDLHKVLDTLLLSTFTSWKAFFPLVKDDPNASYTFVTGGAGDRLLMPGTGFLTVGAAGAVAFCQIVREEYPDVPCKVNEMKLNLGVATPERIAPGFVNHLDVGEAMATILEKKCVSHHVICVNTPADLKTLIVEGKV